MSKRLNNGSFERFSKKGRIEGNNSFLNYFHIVKSGAITEVNPNPIPIPLPGSMPDTIFEIKAQTETMTEPKPKFEFGFRSMVTHKKILKIKITLTPFQDMEVNILDYVHFITKAGATKAEEVVTNKTETSLPSEIKDLLPHMIMGKGHYEICSEKRNIWFTKNKEKPYTFDISILDKTRQWKAIDLTIVEIVDCVIY